MKRSALPLFWGVGLGTDVFEPVIAAGVAEVARPVAGAVVGHDADDLDAEALVVGQGRLQEGDGAPFLLVGHDLGEGDGVVNADMDEFPAAAAAVGGAVAGDAVADPVEAAELLDVEVDHLAGRFALVANDRHGRLQILHPAALENPADRCRGNPGLLGDLFAGPTLATQSLNPLSARLGGRPVEAMRRLRPWRWPPPWALGPRPPPGALPAHQLGSTVRRQARILMGAIRLT